MSAPAALSVEGQAAASAVPPSELPLARALAAVGAVLKRVAFFSFFINLLALTSSIYMLQVYDRVLASYSLPTLLYLSLVAAACLLALGLLEVVRSRLLVRVGIDFDARLASLVFAETLRHGRSGQALRDLDQVRGFATGSTMLSLLDAPWIPVYIALVYLLHPWLGHVALAGGLVLFALGLWNERATRQPLADAGKAISSGTQFAEMSSRNADVIHAMGMMPGLMQRWRQRHQGGIVLQAQASDRAADVSAVAKSVRLSLQIAILGVGAWLVVRQESTAGVMIAASIIMGRGLAPVEAAISGWRSFLLARESYGRLVATVGQAGQPDLSMPLPRPQGELVFENVSAAPPGHPKATVQNLSFKLPAGSSLGVIGPSGAGKSTLARLAVGVWAASTGTVRLDGANLPEWRREEVGPHIGFLPQDIELFAGTVAENIARFRDADPQAVIEAAQLAGAHAMILALPKGYDTPIGPSGANLSGGQRQRIGLARAFFGKPALIVLDEPTSNLDAEGEASVRQAIDSLRDQGRTVIVVAHRPALLGGADRLLVLVNGQIASFGPAAEVMPQITRRANSRPEPDVSTPGASHG